MTETTHACTSQNLIQDGVNTQANRFPHPNNTVAQDSTANVPLLINFVKFEALLKLEESKLSSRQIKEEYWEAKGSVNALISDDSYVQQYLGTSGFTDPSFKYCVISYHWSTPWTEIVKALKKAGTAHDAYFWIDIFCLDQLSATKMETVDRSDEIYGNASVYHFIGFICLSRGWCQLELSSVNPEVKPVFHTNFHTKVMRDFEYYFLSEVSQGNLFNFDSCKFAFETDRPKVEKIIRKRFASICDYDVHVANLLSTNAYWKSFMFQRYLVSSPYTAPLPLFVQAFHIILLTIMNIWVVAFYSADTFTISIVFAIFLACNFFKHLTSQSIRFVRGFISNLAADLGYSGLCWYLCDLSASSAAIGCLFVLTSMLMPVVVYYYSSPSEYLKFNSDMTRYYLRNFEYPGAPTDSTDILADLINSYSSGNIAIDMNALEYAFIVIIALKYASIDAIVFFYLSTDERSPFQTLEFHIVLVICISLNHFRSSLVYGFSIIFVPRPSRENDLPEVDLRSEDDLPEDNLPAGSWVLLLFVALFIIYSSVLAWIYYLDGPVGDYDEKFIAAYVWTPIAVYGCSFVLFCLLPCCGFCAACYAECKRRYRTEHMSMIV